MSLLAIKNLSVTIHGTPVLKDISLGINPGEIFAVTGESGSGKSMTALAAMQLLPQGAAGTGSIKLDGRELSVLTDTALCRIRGNEVGMIFQEPMTALNPVHSIGRQVSETIRLHGTVRPAEARRQAAHTLARVGLPGDRFPAGLFPHELSGGQRQRVVIAMAIARRPRLLIADEPTTALDVTTQAQILTLLQRLVREDGMSLMLITHDLAVVAGLADRLAVMHAGRIVETGQTSAVLHQPRHDYTRSLIAASAHQADLPAPPAPAPMLEARSVTCSYPRARAHPFAPRDRLVAVDRVSLKVPRGARVGLVGESGCGKSTLTRALLGLHPIDSGEITLSGAPVFLNGTANPETRRHMQVVFQDPFGSFNPRHKVARLITEPFHLLDDPPTGAARDTAIAEALTAVGLRPADATRYIHEFSGGQRQRIAIARALIIRPDLILFDEAVSALDVSVRAQILDLLADICRNHRLGYLFISHDLSVVRSVTDRVLVMQAGRIVEEGPTEQVFTQPKHIYTKTLLEAVPRLSDAAAAKGPADHG